MHITIIGYTFNLRQQRLILITTYTACQIIRVIDIPKKPRLITVLTAEELDALDDATFAELAADEEHLHQAHSIDPATTTVRLLFPKKTSILTQSCEGRHDRTHTSCDRGSTCR